jgi:hypothetical protein
VLCTPPGRPLHTCSPCKLWCQITAPLLCASAWASTRMVQQGEMARWLTSDSRGGVPDLLWLTCTSCPQAWQPSKPKCRHKETARENFLVLMAYTYAVASHNYKSDLPSLVVCSSLPQEIKAAHLQGAKESHLHNIILPAASCICSWQLSTNPLVMLFFAGDQSCTLAGGQGVTGQQQR